MEGLKEIQSDPKFVGKNLSVLVHEYIKSMILDKQIQCGEKLQEEKIALQLGVSRTPIREALRKLSMQGLVNIYPNRHAEVISFSDKEIKDLGLLRINMDCLAAQYAVQYGSNADFLNLRIIAEECREAAMQGDMFNRIKKDCDFHIELTKIGNNDFLLKVQKELYLKIQLLQATKYLDVQDSLKKIEHHDLIVEALFERNTGKVLKHIVSHLSSFYGISLDGLKLYSMEDWR